MKFICTALLALVAFAAAPPVHAENYLYSFGSYMLLDDTKDNWVGFYCPDSGYQNSAWLYIGTGNHSGYIEHRLVNSFDDTDDYGFAASMDAEADVWTAQYDGENFYDDELFTSEEYPDTTGYHVSKFTLTLTRVEDRPGSTDVYYWNCDVYGKED
jgi:hypothetical protein